MSDKILSIATEFIKQQGLSDSYLIQAPATYRLKTQSWDTDILSEYYWSVVFAEGCESSSITTGTEVIVTIDEATYEPKFFH